MSDIDLYTATALSMTFPTAGARLTWWKQRIATRLKLTDTAVEYTSAANHEACAKAIQRANDNGLPLGVPSGSCPRSELVQGVPLYSEMIGHPNAKTYTSRTHNTYIEELSGDLSALLHHNVGIECICFGAGGESITSNGKMLETAVNSGFLQLLDSECEHGFVVLAYGRHSESVIRRASKRSGIVVDMQFLWHPAACWDNGLVAETRRNPKKVAAVYHAFLSRVTPGYNRTVQSLTATLIDAWQTGKLMLPRSNKFRNAGSVEEKTMMQQKLMTDYGWSLAARAHAAEPATTDHPDIVLAKRPHELVQLGMEAMIAQGGQLLHARAWSRRYETLKSFRAEHGRLPFYSEKYGDDNIGNWVKVQRKIYNKPGKYRLHKLAPYCIQELEKVPGWTWEHVPVFDVQWQSRLEIAKKFYAQHGRWPIATEKYEDGNISDRIGLWVQDQREFYNKPGKYRVEKLSPYRIQELEKLENWTWKSDVKGFDEHVVQLKRYIAKYKKLPGRKDKLQGSKVNIGAWCSGQRYDKNKGTLSEYRIQELEKVPGWKWKLPTGRQPMLHLDDVNQLKLTSFLDKPS